MGDRFFTLWAVGAALTLSACLHIAEEDEARNAEPFSPSPSGETIAYQLNNGQLGWTAGFADYPLGQEPFYELQQEWRSLPDEISPGYGMFLSGNNHSDDLLMYLQRKLTGLQSDTRYALWFDIQFASNHASRCDGIGGAPGESVHVKAGASSVQPQRNSVSDGIQDYYRLNIDHGNQSQGGEDALVLGNIANDSPDCGSQLYRLKSLNNNGEPFYVTTNQQGELWLFVGFDSGFEGTTAVYLTKIALTYSQAQ